MAIEAIANPKKVYQGSVPKADTQVSVGSKQEMPEPLVTEVKAAEAPVAAKTEKYKPAAVKQKPADKSDLKEPEEKTEPSTGTEAMRKAVDEINRHIKNSEVVFGIHDKTNRITIKIVDKDSRKVLKEYPPEQTLDTIAKIWELAGIMVDEKG